MACGIRASGEGSGPADTPTNGGSRGAAPPGNLGIRTGQRPTIHRLHRCRGPIGPRASVTPARPHHAPARLNRGGNGRRCGGRPPPFLRRGSRECGSPQRHQPQRGSLPGREEFVGAPAAASPPMGGFWPLPSSLLHILSGAGWAPRCPARTAGPRAVSRGSPHYGCGPARCHFPCSVGHPHHPPSGAPDGLAEGGPAVACHEQVEYSSSPCESPMYEPSPSPKAGLILNGSG